MLLRAWADTVEYVPIMAMARDLRLAPRFISRRNSTRPMRFSERSSRARCNFREREERFS